MLPVVLSAALAADSARSIRQIDFKNYAYAWDQPGYGVPSTWHWIKARARTSVTLLDGIHNFSFDGDPPYGVPSLELLSITYGDLDGDGREEAVVDLLYSTGGTANWHYLYVYAIDHGAPRLLARLESGSRADGGLLRIAIQNRKLSLDFADERKRVADCCSDGFIRVAYGWREHRFVEIGPREYGVLQIPIH